MMPAFEFQRAPLKPRVPLKPTWREMSAEEMTELLEAMNLSPAAAACLLHVEERTVRRWTAKERAIPAPAASFLRLLHRTGIEPIRAMELLSREPEMRPAGPA